uniref:GTD-binding domain-containing protein n=1 Tax=Oryza meridionalis TaxID=40149 RepID=A0A0E0E7P6_9ORYZ
MDPIATASWPSTSASSWPRSVRRRVPEAEERELGRRVEEMEEAVERLRAEKEAAEAEERDLRAELDAERAAAETAASEAMLMIERLQREKAAALLEARHFRRLADGRADRDGELQDELASLSALAASYLSLLHAHGIDPDDDDDGSNQQQLQPPVEHLDAEADRESRCSCGGGSDSVVVRAPPSPPPSEKVFAYAAATAPAADCGAEVTENLYARVEALEADWSAMRREVAALRAERAQAVLAREVARRLCREAAVAGERGAVAVAAEKPRFSVLAICKEKEMFYCQVLFIHQYSGSMPLNTAATISSSYLVTTATMIYAQHLAAGLPDTPVDLLYPGVAAFAVGIAGNFYHHYLLSQLRTTTTTATAKQNGGEKEYRIPTGGLFGLATCPHYLFEIVGFFGFAMIAQTAHALAVASGTAAYLAGRSCATRRWYESKFEDFPDSMKALVPYIL